ncbi:hypothetical protein [Halobacillus sp. Marseille-P3879]|uniref:hypothetical protein n=1 Tax=Halobacillus sp. Marseille-P3879 TaxID=2045014 RepID=UPI000C7E10BC|nr:hypothetical protein [Halobacillus sp. Marseille-P3879]
MLSLGFCQFLNGQFLKGLLFILLEVVINIQYNFNQVIIYSFQGDIQSAIEYTNYQWLMFYPYIYMFAIWDAYKDAGGAFSAYFLTVGLIYSSRLELFLRFITLGDRQF